MPELPDVEGFRKILETCAKGRVIERVDVRDTGVLHGISAKGLRDALEGRRFEEPERHGKWLLARTDEQPTLMLHFGMTGRLVCAGSGNQASDDQPQDDPVQDDPVQAHDRVLFTLAGGRRLRYRDQRKLRGLWLAEDESEVDRLLEGQGPDALAVSREEFDSALAGRRGQIKTALTDQSVVAGLGNLLADEILWRARLRPDSRARDLSQADRRDLYTHMRHTLHAAVSAGCVPRRGSWLTGHRDERVPTCPRCGTHLRRSRVGGRGTVWCPHCQPDAS
ncbi:MAG TPA: DNA-formamidopyrimidine glycosylase family protein [Actinospica sp.]|nr:DNA-formamidopyrimidine glycosylase family protein [Actinospica sp.]